MKSLNPHITRLIAILCFAMLPLLSLANDELKKAYELYNDKKYKSALELYSNQLDSTIQQPNLYYNIANCHTKLGNLGLSILNFEKALKFNPNFLEAKNNLNIQEEKILNPLNSKPRTSIISKIIRTPRGNLWNYLALATAVLGGIFFFLAFSKRNKRMHLVGGLFLIFTVTFMFFGYAQHSYWTNSNFGIVLQETQLRIEPNADSEKSYTIPEGTKLKIEQKQGDWFEVKLKDESFWIPSTYLGEI